MKTPSTSANSLLSLAAFSRHLRALPGLALLAGVLLLSGCGSLGVRSSQRTFTTVVVDAGHGGKDSGAISRADRSLREKNCTLPVALALREELKKAGYKVVMTRTDDTFIPLNTRAEISNRQRNAIFVAIHFNDSPRRAIHGIEVYYNSLQAIPLARNLQKSLSQLSSVRFIKTANYRVLRLNKQPAVLVECAYLSNRGDAGRAGSDHFREQLAQQIALGIFATRKGD